MTSADFDATVAENYQFWVRPTLRFGDLDTVGHVNNVASIALIEDCRVRFYQAASTHADDGDDLPGGSWVARKLDVDFMREVRWPADDVRVGTVANRFGNTSATLYHGIFVDGVCCTTAMTIGVRFDTIARAAVPIPEAVKAAMRALSEPL
jgi:acyl-CoA thioester hydrolase